MSVTRSSRLMGHDRARLQKVRPDPLNSLCRCARGSRCRYLQTRHPGRLVRMRVTRFDHFEIGTRSVSARQTPSAGMLPSLLAPALSECHGLRLRPATLVLVAALSVAAPRTAVSKNAGRPSDQIELHDTLEDLCRGVGSPQAALAACNELDRLYPRIRAQGWCKTRPGQRPSERRWHACNRGSS
jgi:hypothetical protein